MSKQVYYVLIVEDNRELARVLRAGVEALGKHFIVFDVPSGEEAMLEAMHRPVDVAIIDLRLPGMGGEEVARRLRKHRPEVKIFMVSGQTEEEIQQTARRVEADAWFRKPVELADLLDTLERKLGLVSSILGETPAPISAAEEEQAVRRMSDIMADLRGALNARTVALLNDVGRVVLQAGALDSYLGDEVLMALMALYARGRKISRMLKAPQAHLHFYLHTKTGRLHLTSLSRQYALLVVCNEHCRSESMDTLAEHLRKAVEDLRRVMERLGILGEISAEATEAMPEPSKAPAPPPEPEAVSEKAEAEGEGSDDLLDLLSSDLSSEEAEAFWDALAEKSAEAPINPDGLSYEQARQLGLAPPGES